MKKLTFTPRHKKLIELKDNIDLLLLGQSNKEYINYLKSLRQKTIEELKAEQSKSWMQQL